MRQSTEVPAEMVRKWQEIVNLLAEIMHVPSALIMRAEAPNIRVLLSSESKGNPYEPDEVASLNTGLYCETVMKTRQPLLVADALADDDWKTNPDIKLGMVSYLGFPISWPDGEIFGTVCLLDNKKNEYSELCRKLLMQYRDVLQADLRSLVTVNAELTTQRAHLEELFARVPEAIVLVDGGGQVVRANPEFTKIFGYTETELLGRSLNDLIVPEELRAEARELTRGRNQRGNLNFETVRTRKDGTRVPVSVIRVPVTSETGGSGTAEYAIYRDITDRKRAEQAARQSEKELRDAIETIPAMVWSTLPDGTADFFNRRWQEFTGLSLEKSSGWDWTASVHPEDFEQYMGKWLTSIATGQPIEGEVRFRRAADGEYRWCLDTGVPLRDEQGNILKWYGIVTDIDDRKRAEDAKAQLAAVVESSDDAIISKDLQGIIRSWNKGAETMFGYTAAEAVGQPVTMLIPSRLVDEEPRILERIRRGEKIDHYETVRRHKDGTEISISLTISPLRDDAGNVVGASKIARDITAAKRAEEALRDAQMELARVARVATLGELTASIAHELNQPLGAIVNNASASLRWLSAQNLQEARRSVEMAIEDGHRAGEIIQRIRSFAKKAPPQKNWIHINETIHEVITLSRGEAQKHRVSIETRLASDLPLILGDRVELQQVILNLIMNAIEAMSGVIERPRELVIVSQSDESSALRISVRDSGPGLEPDTLNRIFTPFYTTKPQGMGMGLAICRSIIEAHGGRLWTSANENGGATFQFTLPTGGSGESR